MGAYRISESTEKVSFPNWLIHPDETPLHIVPQSHKVQDPRFLQLHVFEGCHYTQHGLIRRRFTIPSFPNSQLL